MLKARRRRPSARRQRARTRGEPREIRRFFRGPRVQNRRLPQSLLRPLVGLVAVRSNVVAHQSVIHRTRHCASFRERLDQILGHTGDFPDRLLTRTARAGSEPKAEFARQNLLQNRIIARR